MRSCSETVFAPLAPCQWCGLPHSRFCGETGKPLNLMTSLHRVCWDTGTPAGSLLMSTGKKAEIFKLLRHNAAAFATPGCSFSFAEAVERLRGDEMMMWRFLAGVLQADYDTVVVALQACLFKWSEPLILLSAFSIMYGDVLCPVTTAHNDSSDGTDASVVFFVLHDVRLLLKKQFDVLGSSLFRSLPVSWMRRLLVWVGIWSYTQQPL